jgi:hypothetical protein
MAACFHYEGLSLPCDHDDDDDDDDR